VVPNSCGFGSGSIHVPAIHRAVTSSAMGHSQPVEDLRHRGQVGLQPQLLGPRYLEQQQQQQQGSEGTQC
jgi:hypothetical protein